MVPHPRLQALYQEKDGRGYRWSVTESFTAPERQLYHSIGHVLELREVERLRPFETALGEHLKHRIDARRVIQAAERDEDHSWKTLQVGSEHPGAALRAEVSV